MKMDKFSEEDFQSIKKVLNSMTQRSNLALKNPKLVEMMKERKGHMEIRANSVILRKCVPELGFKVCDSCKENPHRIPKEVLDDLPDINLGGGALWWDLTPDPEHPGKEWQLLF